MFDIIQFIAGGAVGIVIIYLLFKIFSLKEEIKFLKEHPNIAVTKANFHGITVEIYRKKGSLKEAKIILTKAPIQQVEMPYIVFKEIALWVDSVIQNKPQTNFAEELIKTLKEMAPKDNE